MMMENFVGLINKKYYNSDALGKLILIDVMVDLSQAGR